MTAPNTMAKRAAAGTLALAVCFAGGVLGAGAAQAAAGFKFDQRVSGADRFGTAIAASKLAYPDGSGTVVVVQDNATADGLTASYAAGNADAPILYVRRDEIPADVNAEIQRLKASKVIIVGGTGVVSSGVEASLRSGGKTVTRYSGKDRFETAAAVALSGSNDVGTVFIANGDAPADALAAGPIAFKSHNPILLTQAASVPPSTKAALARLNETNRIALGGNAVVSTSTYEELGATNRLSGPNRQGTAVAVADYATANEGFDKSNAALVGPEDRNTADALIAAPLAAKNNVPILFTARGGALSTETETYLKDNADELDGAGYVFGGTAAVSDATASAATTAAGGDGTTPPSNVGFNITPNDTQTLVIPSGTDDTTDDRSYSVDGLDDNLTYNVTLVNADNINIDSAGKVTFKSSADSASASGFSADPGTVTTDITVVNGSPVAANTTASSAKPVGGKLSFTIDGDAPESVYPVVYVRGAAGNSADQGGPSTRLETQATAAGTFAESAEKYGLGGLTTYVPVEAAAGAVGSGPAAGTTTGGGVNISAVNKTAGYFIAAGKTLFYDGNDQFRVNGAPVTLAKFNDSLSTGDGLLSSTYADDPDLQSAFNLDDLTPAAVAGVAADPVDSTSAKITWTAPGTQPDSYVIYRKTGAETATLADYTKVATVPGSTTPLEYTDTGLTASTQYAYAVTQVVDGDESVIDAGSADDVTTSQAGFTAAPESIAAGVTTDDSFAGTVSPGDVYTIAFNRPLDNTAGALAAGAVIRLQDANGESIDLQNNAGGTASPTVNTSEFTVNTQGQTYNGRVQPAGTLLKVQVGAGGTFIDRDGNTSNNNGSVDYPATIVAQSGITATVNTKTVAWNPSTSRDNVLETGATAPTDAGPVAQGAAFTTDAATADGNFSSAGDVFTVSYDEVPVIGTTASITVGGVTLVNGTDVTLSVTGNNLVVTYTAGTGVTALVGKQVTSTTGITDATTSGNGAQPATGYPVTVTP